jgi:hypothetical protein
LLVADLDQTRLREVGARTSMTLRKVPDAIGSRSEFSTEYVDDQFTVTPGRGGLAGCRGRHRVAMTAPASRRQVDRRARLSASLRVGSEISACPRCATGSCRRLQDSLRLRIDSCFPQNGANVSAHISTLRSTAGRFRPTPAACFRASWHLPGPDSHRLVDTDLRTVTSPQDASS